MRFASWCATSPTRHVGYVTGEARYLKTGQAAADVGERAYWDYEMQMKRLETQLGSMVGGDGAIYAIRGTLWRNASRRRHQRLPEPAADRGRRLARRLRAGGGLLRGDRPAVSGPSTGGASASSAAAGARSSRHAGVLNPFRVGLFTWSLWSRTRCCGGHPGCSCAGGSRCRRALRPVDRALARRWPLGRDGSHRHNRRPRWGSPRRMAARRGDGSATFAVINAASLVGVGQGHRWARVSGVWSTPRADVNAGPAGPAASIPVGAALPGRCWRCSRRCAHSSAVRIGSAVDRMVARSGCRSARSWLRLRAGIRCCWRCCELMASARPVQRATRSSRRVCLFVAANDEEPVSSRPSCRMRWRSTTPPTGSRSSSHPTDRWTAPTTSSGDSHRACGCSTFAASRQDRRDQPRPCEP